LVKKVRLERSM